MNDKYNLYFVLSDDTENTVDSEFENFIAQVRFLEKLEVNSNNNFKCVKGRLAKHLDFWIKIGASDFIIDTIQNGYVIPFSEPPVSMFLRNNISAITNEEFVGQAISDLLDSGCVHEIPFKPFVVNPLSVVTNSSGKKRLILDLSVLNKCVKKDKFKFEDWKLALQFFTKDSVLFKFDLNSS